MAGEGIERKNELGQWFKHEDLAFHNYASCGEVKLSVCSRSI
jgi:hypothetical protein